MNDHDTGEPRALKDACVVRGRGVGKVPSFSATRRHPILQQLGRIARNRRKTGIIAAGEPDNAYLWRKIRNADEQLAHLVSARIVQFAAEQGACILVFEHLGNLKPEKGKYSRRGNTKRAFWMKGRIFKYAKYKAYNKGILTSRVNPRNTSRECARCHSLVARYEQGKPATGYTMGAPLVLCLKCGMKGNADRNASLVIASRLRSRYAESCKEKPHTALRRGGREEKSSGVVLSQDAQSAKVGHLPTAPRMETATGMAPPKEGTLRMEKRSCDIPTQLRFPFE